MICGWQCVMEEKQRRLQNEIGVATLTDLLNFVAKFRSAWHLRKDLNGE
jgi:hypothetical protein